MNIEELAFKDRKTLEQLNKKDLLDIIEFVQLDRKQWINQFSKTHNEKVDIRKENQELKKHLKVPKACSLKTLKDYKSYYEDTTREQILEDTYIEYCAYVNLAHRYSELKKQLEDKTEDYRRMKDNFDSKVDILTEIDTQQKEFIKYLEDYQDGASRSLDPYDCGINDCLGDVLSKYKEIIGDDK